LITLSASGQDQDQDHVYDKKKLPFSAANLGTIIYDWRIGHGEMIWLGVLSTFPKIAPLP